MEKNRDIHPSPDTEKESAEAFAERLKLKEQYLSQVKVLYQSGLLENFAPTSERPRPELGIVGIDGKEYPLPSYEAILKSLQDKEMREFLMKKAEQGLNKLLLVPFAMPLSVIIERYKQALLKTHKEKGLKSTDGEIFDLDTQKPVNVWKDLSQCDNPYTPKEDQIEYGVTNYEGETKEQREGKYKSELLSQSTNGWQLLLCEEDPDIPAKDQGRTIAGRKQPEAFESPKDYLKCLREDPQYGGEEGFTPEAALIHWLTALQEKQTILDDFQGKGKVNYLTGNVLSGDVPSFFWYRGDHLSCLDNNVPDYRDPNDGCRFAVRIKPITS